MSDEGLREAYERALAGRSPGERAACPTPESILALVRRDGPEEQRVELLDHVMACSACRDEFELLRAIERAAEKAARTEAAASSSGSAEPGRVVGHITWRRWAPPLAAAALLLLFALGPGRGLWRRAENPVRSGAESLALATPADGIALPGPTITFVWHPSAGAERYTLELLTSGGTVAASGTTSDTTLTLTLPPNLVPGGYRWWVSATSAGGAETRSDTRSLRLRGR